MKTANLQFNFHAVQLLCSSIGAALEHVGDIPTEYMPICTSLAQFFMAANKTDTWSYAATADDHLFLRISLSALVKALQADSVDDDDCARLLADISHMDGQIKARYQQMLTRALH